MRRSILVVGLLALAVPARADKKKDEADLKAIAVAFDDAWNKGDAKGQAALYAEDGWLADMFSSAHGRAAIEKHFAELQAGPLKGVKSKLELKDWEEVKPDLALVSLTQTTTGGAFPDGRPIPPTPFNIGCMATKKAGKWRLRFCSVGLIPTPPPGPRK